MPDVVSGPELQRLFKHKNLIVDDQWIHRHIYGWTRRNPDPRNIKLKIKEKFLNISRRRRRDFSIELNILKKPPEKKKSLKIN